MRCFSRPFPLLAALLLGLSTAGAAARDATPETADCTVAPRSAEAVVALWFDPDGTPFPQPGTHRHDIEVTPLPKGSLADATMATAVDAVVHEWIACVDARQFLRAYALMTDALLRDLGFDYADPVSDTPAEVAALLTGQLAGTPIAALGQPTEPTPVDGPRDLRVLPDGRVGGIWTIGGSDLYLALARADGGWRLDEIGYLPPTDTSADATPAH